MWVGGVLAVAVAVLASPLTPEHLRLEGRASAVDRRIATHHGIRLATALGVSAVVAEVAGHGTPLRPHAFWMAVGVWVVLQPHLHDTVTKGVQRAAGTLVGGALSVALLQTLPTDLWFGWLVLALAFVCFGIRSVNYGWYCVVLTPIVVLGFSPIVADNAVLEARLGWTAAGIVLALAVRFAMWPTASHRLPAATTTP